MNRKITVILASDIAGYSRLVADDEEESLRRFASYRGVFQDLVAHSKGRIFNTAGDAILAEFPSAVEALRCAIDIQESVRTRNLAYPPSRQMLFRMGMTIGDVVECNGDLLGDGVNIAARLQALARPGGICVSKGLHDAVSNKLSASYSDLGVHTVKNIPNPIHVFSVGLAGPAVSPPRKSLISLAANVVRGPVAAASFVVLAVAIGVGIAYLSGATKPPAKPAVSASSNAETTASASPQPAKQVLAPSASSAEGSTHLANDTAASQPVGGGEDHGGEPHADTNTPASTVNPPTENTKVATAVPANALPDDQDITQLSRLRSTQWANCRGEDTAAALAACERLIGASDVQGQDLALAHEKLAYALRKQGKLDEAIASFTTSIGIAKTSEAYNERGTAYFIKGKIPDAISDYSTAISEDGANGDAFNNRAWAYYTSGQVQDALTDADKAIALSPDKAYVWDTHGHIEEKLANRNAAVRDFKKALSLDPKLQSSEDALKRLAAD